MKLARASPQLIRVALVLLAAAAICAAAQGGPTLEEAKAFVKKVDAELKPLLVKAQTADWIKATYITDDTERNSAAANDELMGYMARTIKESLHFSQLSLDPDTARMTYLLRTA
ncbi:MAG TPA: M2 family metallopeptidase, partial [Myxococcaceae bacterium]|nr:M2 family metallopeptidase [Myxococcaceae bacterium]